MEYQLDIYFSIQSSLISMGDEFFFTKGANDASGNIGNPFFSLNDWEYRGKREIRSIRKDILLASGIASPINSFHFFLFPRDHPLYSYISCTTIVCPWKILASGLLLIREVTASFRDFIVQLLSSSFEKNKWKSERFCNRVYNIAIV